MWKRLNVLLKPEGDDAGGGGGGGGGAAAGAAGQQAGGGDGGAKQGAASGDGKAAGQQGSTDAGAKGGGANDGKAGTGEAGATGGDAGKAIWPENWRETVSKDDAKVLARLQRYGSPEAALQALIAAQNRISSGELKPVLNKNATPEDLKEWRAAHGIPETPDKYDLGKDVKIEEHDKPFFELLFKNAHATNQTPDQLKATVKTWYFVREKIQEHQEKTDAKFKQDSEDALRTEWGNEYRRNTNLIQGLLDLTGSQDLAADLLEARLSDGRRIKDSPEMQKMLLSVALINNPTGVVVPGGSGATGEGIREALEKLQKIPASKKTPKQDEEQRGLIDAAIKANLMDDRGAWKK